MREIDQMAVSAANDSQILNEFVARHELFILKSASKTAKSYVSKSDDEWSIALSAFVEAVKKYDYARGSFLSFAELIIHRSLVDYYRVQRRYSTEVQVGWIEDSAIVEDNDNDLKLEIEAISQVFESYDFTFMDLAECSPKAGKTKTACGKAIVFLVGKPLLIKEMRNSKQLPVKIIEKYAGIPRKILERHRKYIIAAAEILHGDYPHLSEYLSYVGEEDER
ncbi:MAG TPA: sigma factor [Candidatus Limnocylindrales bacterium]|nr:sigma factor [Candidatus Limnocylindrales bacterium]